jgi:hypothetical protein
MFTIDDLQLIQIAFTQLHQDGLLDGNEAMQRVRAKVEQEINRLQKPDQWEKDQREIRASEEAKKWNVVGCAVGRAFAAKAKELQAGRDVQQLTFSMSSSEVREMVRTVNRFVPHPSSITGVLMRRMHLAEPMFMQLTKAKACQFIYDRDAKMVSARVRFA